MGRHNSVGVAECSWDDEFILKQARRTFRKALARGKFVESRDEQMES